MRILVAALALLAIAAGCNTRDLKASGAPCTATSECQEGLTCDFGQDPPTCASNQSGGDGDGDDDAAPIDAPPGPIDAAPADAGIDAS